MVTKKTKGLGRGLEALLGPKVDDSLAAQAAAAIAAPALDAVATTPGCVLDDLDLMRRRCRRAERRGIRHHHRLVATEAVDGVRDRAAHPGGRRRTATPTPATSHQSR